jgi:uncharacterized protein YjlB
VLASNPASILNQILGHTGIPRAGVNLKRSCSKGWVDLEFEDGTKVRLTAGDSLMIPGGTRHNETGTADELELLEISVPAEMHTVPCDPPHGRA